MSLLIILILIAVLLVLLFGAYTVHVRRARDHHDETMNAIDALRDEIADEADRRAYTKLVTGSFDPVPGKHRLAEITTQIPAIAEDEPETEDAEPEHRPMSHTVPWADTKRRMAQIRAAQAEPGEHSWPTTDQEDS
jgi:hypothetical protein